MLKVAKGVWGRIIGEREERKGHNAKERWRGLLEVISLPFKWTGKSQEKHYSNHC
jgi:hypothetical protein